VITLTESNGGLVLAVRAQPGAKRTGLTGEHSGALKVAVTAPAVEGKANQALVEALRDLLNLKRSQIQLLSGETRRDKCVLITGIARADLESRIQALL
jgi:uncharacterized protein (TIGR00251 family)